jgi:hypothetical protein
MDGGKMAAFSRRNCDKNAAFLCQGVAKTPPL